MTAKPKPESDTARLQQRNRELAILKTIAEALNREVDLSQALDAALAHATALFNLHTGWIWLLDEETGEHYLAAARDLPPALADNPRRMTGTCYCLDTYRSGDLPGATNVSIITCSRLKSLVAGTAGLRAHASVPLYAHGRQLGVLNVVGADWQELSPDDLRLLYTVGDLMSMAIERARLFARSVQLGAAEERNRLAREIHDTLAQGLAATTLHLEMADALLEGGGGSERARQAVRQALALTRANMEEARRSVHDLRAAPLEGRGLPAALQALAEESAARGGFAAHVEVVDGTRPLPARVEAGLYRIAQEVLTNVVRHARARQVAVQLVLRPDRLHLTITDDGRGFDPLATPRDRYGLIGLNERARLLGGALRVQSAPGAGTRLDVEIPLEGRR
jgi:two-component system NarL family sensor kinase